MAHEYLIKLIEVAPDESTQSELASVAWNYADLMQAEADKRNKTEAEQKRKAVREMLNADNTFLEKEGQHFDDVADVCKTYSSSEWQPDWSQAPDGFNWWTQDKWGSFWYDQEPKWIENEWGGYIVNKNNRSATKLAPSFNYDGNWQDSLRKRPSNI